MTNSFKTPSLRSPNVVRANVEVDTSADGLRKAVYRNVKVSMGLGRYDITRTAWLRIKRDGQWHTVTTSVSPEAGKRWIETGKWP